MVDKILERLHGPIQIFSKIHATQYIGEGVKSKMKFGPTRKNFVWLINNHIIGTYTCSRTSQNECWLTNVYVDSSFRGLGISKLIMEHAARKSGCNVLTVRPDNTIAIALYKKYGFRYKGNLDGSLLFARDGWIASGIDKAHYDTKTPHLIW